MKLQKSFNQHCLQIYDKCDKTIIKVSKWDRVYIIKYIAKSFSEFALIFAMHTLHSKIVFSAAASDMNLYV